MQSLERDQLIKIRKAMELLQARPREHLFLAFLFNSRKAVQGMGLIFFGVRRGLSFMFFLVTFNFLQLVSFNSPTTTNHPNHL